MLFTVYTFSQASPLQTSTDNGNDTMQRGTILGCVYSDVNGLPCIGAVVAILGTHIACMSDIKGEYCLPDLEPGYYSLVASMVGIPQRTVENVEVIQGGTTIIDFGSLDSTLQYGYQGFVEFPVSAEMAELTIEKTDTSYSSFINIPILNQFNYFANIWNGRVSVSSSHNRRRVNYTGELESIEDSTFFFCIKPSRPILFSMDEVHDYLCSGFQINRAIRFNFEVFPSEEEPLPESVLLIASDYNYGWIDSIKVYLAPAFGGAWPNVPQIPHNYLSIRTRTPSTYTGYEDFYEYIIIETKIEANYYSYDYMYNLFAHVILNGPYNCNVYVREYPYHELRYVGKCVIFAETNENSLYQ